MKKPLKLLKVTCSAILLAGAQISVLVAVVGSRIGERTLRGARGFAAYREVLTGQS